MGTFHDLVAGLDQTAEGGGLADAGQGLGRDRMCDRVAEPNIDPDIGVGGGGPRKVPGHPDHPGAHTRALGAGSRHPVPQVSVDGVAE